MADIWKRTFTQILTKGIVLEHWGHKAYWVVQEPVYQNFVDRYNLSSLGYVDSHSSVFAIYDMRLEGSRFQLHQTRIESSTIDGLFRAFRHNPNVPSKEKFVTKLRNRITANMELKLRLSGTPADDSQH